MKIATNSAVITKSMPWVLKGIKDPKIPPKGGSGYPIALIQQSDKTINQPLSTSSGGSVEQRMEKDSSHMPKIKYHFFFPTPLNFSSIEMP